MIVLRKRENNMAIKIQDFIKELNAMSVQDLNELVKAIEEEFGVTAAAPIAAGAADGASADSDEKTLTLTEVGGNKVAVIKIIRDMMGLGLMEAKQFVDNAPGVIKENVSQDDAAAIIAQFSEAGATITES
jgi:large subunit ribosomal protein L7/L12